MADSWTRRRTTGSLQRDGLMTRPRFTMVVLLIEDVPRSLAFYRRLGVEFAPDADTKTDLQVPIGDQHQMVLTTQFVRNDPDREPPSGGSRVVLEVFVDSRAEGDAKFAELTRAGYRGRREPWLARFGAYMWMGGEPHRKTGLLHPRRRGSRPSAPIAG